MDKYTLKHSHTIGSLAASGGQVAILSMLIDHYGPDWISERFVERDGGRCPILHEPVSKGYLGVVKLLIKHGALTDRRVTPLSTSMLRDAARWGHLGLVQFPLAESEYIRLI